MIRWILTCFFLLLSAQVAFGVADPRPDVLGVYFDDRGDQTCNDAIPPGTQFSMFLVYTNPTVDSILGFEAGYYWSGIFIELPVQWPCGLIWIVEPDLGNMSVTCAEPFPTSTATPLLQMNYFYLGGSEPIGVFHVEKAPGSVQPGTGPNILLADGTYLEVQAGEPAHLVPHCIVTTTAREWGAVKSLFR